MEPHLLTSLITKLVVCRNKLHSYNVTVRTARRVGAVKATWLTLFIDYQGSVRRLGWIRHWYWNLPTNQRATTNQSDRFGHIKEVGRISHGAPTSAKGNKVETGWHLWNQQLPLIWRRSQPWSIPRPCHYRFSACHMAPSVEKQHLPWLW